MKYCFKASNKDVPISWWKRPRPNCRHSSGAEYNSMEAGYPENGAGGGGAVDIRLDYYDINIDDFNESALNKSIESRIIVAGSGGGAVSGKSVVWGSSEGFPGGNISAISNGPYTIGGSQILGKLGMGKEGLNSAQNQGASGGCGSGYRGGYNELPFTSNTGYYKIGGTGGSSYISGHPGCISPSHSTDLVSDNKNSIHESGLVFDNTKIISGNETMPSPFNSSSIQGNVGNGICRITILPSFITILRKEDMINK